MNSWDRNDATSRATTPRYSWRKRRATCRHAAAPKRPRVEARRASMPHRGTRHAALEVLPPPHQHPHLFGVRRLNVTRPLAGIRSLSRLTENTNQRRNHVGAICTAFPLHESASTFDLLVLSFNVYALIHIRRFLKTALRA